MMLERYSMSYLHLALKGKTIDKVIQEDDIIVLVFTDGNYATFNQRRDIINEERVASMIKESSLPLNTNTPQYSNDTSCSCCDCHNNPMSIPNYPWGAK